MRYLVLPFILILGLVELVIRLTAFLAFVLGTFTIGLIFIGCDARGPEALRDFLKPACFDIARGLAQGTS